MGKQQHIAILGAGPGGYVAAIRAAQLGARVTVIENQALGGVCLNWGCIPSKALLAVVELGDKVKKAADYGLTVEGSIGYDPVRMVARKNKVVEGLVKGIATLFKIWNIEHIEGTGELLDAKSLRIAKRDGTEATVQADAIVIATGSSWPNLPLFPVDGKQIITSKEALDLSSIPKSLLIVGGGVEGCEFASLYSGLGTKVTVVEMMPQVLPLEDEEITAFMARELKKRGVELCVGTTVEKVERQPGLVRATLKDGTVVEVQQILVSVGRGLNSKGIGLEKAGVQVGTRGEILVNDRMETNVRGVYAIGDVVGKAMLAHVASAQGKVAVQNILGHTSKVSYNLIPAGIFTLPEIGRVGLTEQQARAKVQEVGRNPDTDVKIGRFRYAALGKAQGTGDITGMFKIIRDGKTQNILGVHIIGSHAADLVHEAAMAMHMGATPAQMADMIHAHPTLSEGLMEAAEDIEGMAIHLARKKPS
ncbi:MAG: dihydrolipoyl dehydrogenase [Nitrospirae bacterium RIFCSPLOWO2_02_FULL_62_14]|nr:MAG: dihydrolipoyl dehydrogenase [Nitrospirae bacterium RIFCSPLOWO2_02_FULL_62_14]